MAADTRVRASGGATGERSVYGPLANLLNAAGAALKPEEVQHFTDIARRIALILLLTGSGARAFAQPIA